MTATTGESGAVPGVQIEFQDGMTPEQRRNVELSVASMVTRSKEATAPTLATSARLTKLTAELHRPLLKVIESDPDAARALAEARTNFPGVDNLVESIPAGAPIAGADDVVTIELRGTPEVFVTPLHFAWSWHDQAGGAPFQSFAVRSTGEVLVNGRAGNIEAGAEVFVNAHAGFGISLRTDQQVTATARSLRKMEYQWGCRPVLTPTRPPRAVRNSPSLRTEPSCQAPSPAT